ncbi:MAG: alpha-amylase [Chloroflexi bacterium]|nr:alpha-amylase [Chloroflexota bacterium]
MNITVPDWVRDAIFYQIFPDRFAKSNQFEEKGYLPKPQHLQAWEAEPTYHAFKGGDLLGITEKLDYLENLGINAIYLNPIFSSASNHRYHTYDYFSVDPLLGGNRAFKTFLDAAQNKNIRVVLDGVFNHASRGFFQFNHLMECGQESPYLDWFHIHGWPVNAFNDHQPPNYDAWWGLRSLPKFNINTPAVREFLWRVGTYWIEQGIDGWRLDVPNEIDDDLFWQTFRQRCKAINPDAYIVGELWGEAHRWLQGDQFDGQMNYLFARAALGFFSGHNMDQTDTVRSGYGHIQPLDGHGFGRELERVFNTLYHPEVVLSQMNMLGSHDTPRMMTVAGKDKTAVRLMYLCQMTVPGAPNIYYGDEIGLVGGHDPHCRGAFPWDAPSEWDGALREAIQQAIQLRHQSVALRRGDFQLLYADDCVVVYQRQFEGETAVIAFNIDSQPRTIQFSHQFSTQLPEKLTSIGTSYSPSQPITILSHDARIWINID